ncbi:ATP-binding protein [Nocardia salmonicida]|uniref:ATP-binding protein n=1 Tax=Nocardia salmonicida TaxID=53431 RepID=UPI000B131459|nr:hypothetical protein [Nocardia salmonicida]MBC7299460.1 hypothetical protein [Nocardia sp.]
MALQIAENFSLPPEMVTETLVVLAKRGAGKTYAASVLAEEMIGAGLPVCVIDPLGVWWGLRSAADGDGPGLPVTILGGDHADLDLPPDSGIAVADLIVEKPLPLVVDLSRFSKTQQRHWVTEYFEHLFRRNREPLHIIIDEADLFAPQRATAGQARLLGAYDDIQRRGRAKGIGTTSITQRAATLHKDILSQAEMLIALRMTGTHDIGAIDEWVRVHAEPEQANQVKASLPSLPVGTAWVWSPGWLDILTNIQVRRRHTFDSSATPKQGRVQIQPTSFAPVDAADLDRVRDHLGAPTAPDTAASPQLQQRIRHLQNKLDDLRARPPRVERIEVPVLGDADRALLAETADQLEALTTMIRSTLTSVTPQTLPTASPITSPVAPTPAPDAVGNGHQPAAIVVEDRTETGALKAGARKMLDVLARQYPLQITRAQLASLAGLKASGGTFNTYFSTLRRAGLIDLYGKLVCLNDRGLAHVGKAATSTPMTSAEIRTQWESVLRAGARTMLNVVIDRWPETITRAELAAHAELEPTGGTFGTYLSKLRTNGLIDVDGDTIRANQVFFLDHSTAAPPTR